MEDKYTHTTKRTGHRDHHRYKGQRAHRTHSKSPPAVDIGNGQTIAGDPYRTAASRHTWAAHPRIAHIAGDPHRTAASRHTWAAHPRIAHIAGDPHRKAASRHTWAVHRRIAHNTDVEISPSWHNHTNPIKHYHHTFQWKPDDGRNRLKHVVTIILY